MKWIPSTYLHIWNTVVDNDHHKRGNYCDCDKVA